VREAVFLVQRDIVYSFVCTASAALVIMAWRGRATQHAGGERATQQGIGPDERHPG